MIKAFRGILEDGGQDRIRLSTIQGKIGYRITKFQVFPNLPGTVQQESTVMVWKTEQASVSTSTATVDFTDSNLLGAVHYQDSASVDNANGPLVVMFDREIFNQDIYVTHTDTTDAKLMNYYLELEVISLTDMGAEYTTIKDIRTQQQ